MSLNSVWSDGDDLRVLVALDIPLGQYPVQQIQSDMNLMAAAYASLVPRVLDLLDAWDSAQDAVASQNISSSDGRVLTKADVLEWTVANAGQPSPTSELERIRYLLRQYFSYSVLLDQYANPDSTGNFRLVRS
jgi:hypothetical protein